MEVVIILIIIGIIGYLIYQSLPSTKFEKAQAHFNAKNYVEAINVLNEIFDKHNDAPAKFAECKLIIGQGLKENMEKLKAFNEILELRKRTNNSSSVAKLENIEAKALLEIAKIQYEESKTDIDKLNQNLKFIDIVNKKGLETEFASLRAKHIDGPARIAESKLTFAQSLKFKSEKLVALNEILALRQKINNSTSIAKYEIIEAKTLLEIAKIRYEETKGDIDQLIQNIKFIDTANKNGAETGFSTLKTKHIHQLSESYFKKAIDQEKSNKYPEAIQVYKKAIECSEKSSNLTTKYNAVARISICRLKLNENIDLQDNSGVKKSDKEYQKDLYYRYSVNLLKNGNFQQAENIISTHLNFKSSEVDKLKDILKAEKLNLALNQITAINQKIEQLYDNSLITDELSTFYNELDSIIAYLKPISPELSEKVKAIKPTLFNRLLTNYISIEQYGNAINLIQKYPKFWESPELLKNLGICCYGYTSKGLLTEKNYKIVISGWLTSVYSDKVILKSLQDTSWDDNYTFSLAESIGSNYSHHEEVPENVNYDEVSESNISIGSTQRELIQQFETIIHKEIQDHHLSNLVNDFYNKEKESLEKVVEILASDILFPTPHFAISNGLNNEIIKELDSDYEEYLNEEALEAGVPYIKNSTSSVVYQYYFANDLIERIESAIEDESLTAIKKLNTTENKGWIEKFDKICSAVEDRLYNQISTKISVDDEIEALISIMEECISISRNNEKLKHQYSNYVASYCISQVNAENIDNYKALSLMKGAYFRSPNNPRICKNFITLIKFNLMDILNDKTRKISDIYKILDWVKSNMSKTYKQNSSELSNARKEILQQLKEAGVDTSLFDDSPSGIITRPLGQSLNAEGLKIKKVLTYFKDLGSIQETTNPLDRLRPGIQVRMDDMF